MSKLEMAILVATVLPVAVVGLSLVGAVLEHFTP
jgi:hypothetical protein